MSARAPEKHPALSVVIPAFNEERRLGATLERVLAWLGSRPGTWEVLVVDDGSRDRTREVAAEASRQDARVRLVAQPRNMGKGAAVKAGFLAAQGDVVLFSDADLSTPIEELDKLRAEMDRAGAAIAIGSRALPGSDVRVKQHALRQLMGQTFNVLVRGLMGLPFHDTQCGFKLFRREPCLPLFRAQRVGGFAFDPELLFLARRASLGVVEVPVVWLNSPDSKVKIWRDPALMLKDMLRIRWHAALGRYGSERP